MSEKIVNVHEFVSPVRNWEIIRGEYDALIVTRAYETLTDLYRVHQKHTRTRSIVNNYEPFITVQSPAGLQVKQTGEKQVSRDRGYQPLLSGIYEASLGVNTVKMTWRFDYTTGKKLLQKNTAVYQAYKELQIEIDTGMLIRILSKEKALFTKPNEMIYHKSLNIAQPIWGRELQQGKYPIREALIQMYHEQVGITPEKS